MNHDQSHPSEGSGLDRQCFDRTDSLAADLSSFGIGSVEAMQRDLVLPLQFHFSPPLHRHDDSGDILTPAGELVLHHTLHGKLLHAVLLLADSLRSIADQCHRLSGALRGVDR